MVGFDVFRMKCFSDVHIIGWLFKFNNRLLVRCLQVWVELAGWGLSCGGAPASLFHWWGALYVFYLRLVRFPRDFSKLLLHPPFSLVASFYCAWCPSFCRVTQAAGWLHRGGELV